MTSVQIFTDIDAQDILPGVDRSKLVQIQSGVIFVRVPKGMESGKSSVAVVAPLGDGKYTFIELSMANFEGVAAAFKGAEERDKQESN